MNRIDRLSAIVIQLQSKKVVTAAEIAERFNISLRTVYRDIRALEEAGIPVGAEAGIGYFLDENYKLPPVMFTSQEAAAMIVAGKLIESFPDCGTQTAFESALYKIKSVLRPSQKDHVEALSESMRVFIPAANNAKEYSYLSDIQQALTLHQAIEIRYFAQYKNLEEQRCVLPIGLTYYMRDWHLIAWCQKRQDYRDFRVDRIKSLTTTDQTFNPARYLSLNAYLKQWHTTLDLIEIVLHMPSTTLKPVEGSKYWFGFVSETAISETAIEVIFYNHDLAGFAKWLLGLKPPLTVIKPPELRTIMTEYVSELRFWLTDNC